MGEFDEAVRVALRERAEGAVRVEELLAGARRRGVWRRRMRHALLGCGSAAAVAVVVLVSAFVLRPPDEGKLETAEILGVSTLPRPPVGGPDDTNLLRLDVADPAVQWLEWTADSDERQALRVGGTGEYVVLRGRSEADLDTMLGHSLRPANAALELVPVGGVTGTLRLSGRLEGGYRWASLRWKRADGTWLGLFMSFGTSAGAGPVVADRAKILEAAQWIRANVGYRCVADFRLAWIPPGARPIGCRMGLTKYDHIYGLLYADGKQGTFLAFTERWVDPASTADMVLSSDKWLTGFLSNAERLRYGDQTYRVFTVGGAGLSGDDLRQLTGGFVELDDPMPDR